MCVGDQIYEGEIESGYLKDSEIKASHPLTRGRTILINCFRLKQYVKINEVSVQKVIGSKGKTKTRA